jgi:hypothetical protein
VDRERVGAVPREGLEDRIGGFGPDQRLGIMLVSLDEGSDVGLQLVNAVINAALDLLVREHREPALDLVSRNAGRGEVQMVARSRASRDLTGGALWVA